MYKKVAIEEGLTHIVDAIQAAGYQTTSLEDNDFYNVQAIVVRGDTNEFITAEKNLKQPIINAAGRTANEVVHLINDRLH